MPQGWVANRKKVQCLWREEGLKVPAYGRKCRRLATTRVLVPVPEGDRVDLLGHSARR